MAMNLVLEVGGATYSVSVDADEDLYTVALPSGTFTFDVRRTGEGHALSLLKEGESYEAWAVRNGSGYRVQVLGASFDIEVEDALRARLKALEPRRETKEHIVTAPMPGVVVELEVGVGDRVEAGDALIIVEAMKMRNELASSIAGTVASIHVEPGQSVERNAKLCVVTPEKENDR